MQCNLWINKVRPKQKTYILRDGFNKKIWICPYLGLTSPQIWKRNKKTCCFLGLFSSFGTKKSFFSLPPTGGINCCPHLSHQPLPTPTSANHHGGWWQWQWWMLVVEWWWVVVVGVRGGWLCWVVAVGVREKTEPSHNLSCCKSKNYMDWLPLCLIIKL